MRDKKKKYPKLLSLDLELNKNEDTNAEGNVTDIIQIGACVLNTETMEIEDLFNRYVSIITPMNNGELRLSRFITKLTGITDNKLNQEGVSLVDAVIDLYEFCKARELYRSGIEWGYADFSILQDQFLRRGGDPKKWYFARSHFDTKKIFQAQRIFLGENPQSGLSKSMSRLGLQFKGIKHNALDDAINTAEMFVGLNQFLRILDKKF